MNLEEAIYKLEQLKLGKKQQAVIEIIEELLREHKKDILLYDIGISDLWKDLKRANPKEFNNMIDRLDEILSEQTDIEKILENANILDDD